jgi:RNA polymerase sigma-70 factor (ECF subfamily)
MRRHLHSRSQAPAAGQDVPADPDALLVANALRDRLAFSPLFNRYWEAIFKFCYHQIGDWHAAEDAAGEVFLKALANLEHFDPGLPGTSFRAWLFGIARHVIGTSHRYTARHPQTPLDDVFDTRDTGQTVEELVLAAEQHDQLRALLDQLPADQRELLELRLAGLSAVEIGRVMGRTQAAIRKAQSRSVIGLRDALKRQELTTGGHRHG